MDENIIFRAVIEVIGKPQEHIEKAIKEYIDNLKKTENYKVVSVELSKAKKREKEELWTIFAEMEIKTKKINDLINFCFDYMPSIIEVLQPGEFAIKDMDVSNFLNDLQSKLHDVDMVAKQLKLENQHLKKNVNALMKNYVIVLLKKGNLTSDQMSKLTGVSKDQLEDFLDQMIDLGRIEFKNDIYSLKN